MRRIVDGVSVDGGNKTRALVLALLALACGHMLSTLLRTIPAISLDVMAADFATTPQTLAGLTSIYHFFVCRVADLVGAAMDRFGVRPVSLSLLVGTVVGAMASGLATGPESFLFGQFLLGVATSGMLMCPMTLAAKKLSPWRFPVVGRDPVDRQYRHAAVVEPAGLCRRSSGLATPAFGIWRPRGRGLVCGLRPGTETGGHSRRRSSPLSQMADVFRLGLSRPLRGLIASRWSRWRLVGAAGILGRPVADGGQGIQPHRGRQRAGPFHAGIDRWAAMHRGPRPKIRPSPGDCRCRTFFPALFLVLMAAGAPHFPVSNLFGVTVMSSRYDLVLLVLIGFAISAQPLLFGMTRQVVDAQCRQGAVGDQPGLLSGAALIQSATGVVAAL